MIQPKRVIRRYTREDDKAIVAMFDAGATWRQIAIAIGSNWHSVRSRAYLLGLKRMEKVRAGENGPSKKTIINRRYQAKYPEKRKAHKAVEWGMVSGKISREPCANCGCVSTQAHHSDYEKPLEVIWLCQACHSAEHRSKSL